MIIKEENDMRKKLKWRFQLKWQILLSLRKRNRKYNGLSMAILSLVMWIKPHVDERKQISKNSEVNEYKGHE